MKSNPIPYRIFAISMAVLMFFTSAGFTVDLHYCQGQLKTFNFFGIAKSCHEIGQGMKNCPHHKKMMETDQNKEAAVAKKGCCSNKTLNFQSDLDQQIQLNKTVVLNTALQHFVCAFVETFFNNSVLETENPSYAHYRPPLIPRDIHVLLETFRL